LNAEGQTQLRIEIGRGARAASKLTESRKLERLMKRRWESRIAQEAVSNLCLRRGKESLWSGGGWVDNKKLGRNSCQNRSSDSVRKITLRIERTSPSAYTSEASSKLRFVG